MKRNSFIAAMGIAVSATLSVGFVNVISPRVIYGDDNRVEVYQVDRADVREMADSTVALIPSKDLKMVEGGLFKVNAPRFGDDRKLCADEPFFDQPTGANCSGFLVGEDLIATAGHCISASECSKYSIVFGYKMEDAHTAPETVLASDVYNCRQIVAQEMTNEQDYALVRLDRAVRGHRVLTLQQTPAQSHDSIYVVGHPSGLPAKVAGGAQVRTQRGAFFQANLDTYGGNSGSAVFNANTNEVVGILVRGERDFIYDSARQCTVSNKCADNQCRGEDVTNISYIVNSLKR